MEFVKTKTKDGNLKYDVIIGDIRLICYNTISNSYAVHGKKVNDVHKAEHYCTLKKDTLKPTLERCVDINKYGGDCVKYLKSFKTRQSRPEYISKDGKVRGYYHHDKEKDGFIPKINDHGVKGHISKVVKTEKEAEKIVKDAVDEYDRTGRYVRCLDRPQKSNLPHASVIINGNTSLDSLKPKTPVHANYDSMGDYIIRKFGDGNSLKNHEILIIYTDDGCSTKITSANKFVKVNDTMNLLMLYGKVGGEIIINIDKISRVILK